MTHEVQPEGRCPECDGHGTVGSHGERETCTLCGGTGSWLGETSPGAGDGLERVQVPNMDKMARPTDLNKRGLLQ